MRKGTTPTINFSLVDENNNLIDLSSYTVYLTLADKKGSQFTVSNDRMTFNDDYSVDVMLTQEETLSMKGIAVFAQIRAINEDEIAIASNQISTSLESILKGGVISYDI